MHWNHRIVDLTAMNGGDPWFEVSEVHYGFDGVPEGHTSVCMGDESPEALVGLLQKMIDDIRNRPEVVLFPEEQA